VVDLKWSYVLPQSGRPPSRRERTLGLTVSRKVVPAYVSTAVAACGANVWA